MLAFLDIRPVNPGHTLVVPRRHYACLAELSEDDGARLFVIAQRLAATIRRSGVRCEGITLFLADGEAASQEVFHCHLHVLPRFAGDAFRINADVSVSPARAELDTIAKRLRAAYKQAD
jgi:histidine triad (HIT) family protein